MAKLITAAERIDRSRKLIQQARDYPLPDEGVGWMDFSYAAQVKDLLRQAREMIKFISYTSGLSNEVKEESKVVFSEIEQADKELLHHNRS
jgi:hypothetical protein